MYIHVLVQWPSNTMHDGSDDSQSKLFLGQHRELLLWRAKGWIRDVKRDCRTLELAIGRCLLVDQIVTRAFFTAAWRYKWSGVVRQSLGRVFIKRGFLCTARWENTHKFWLVIGLTSCTNTPIIPPWFPFLLGMRALHERANASSIPLWMRLSQAL